MSRPYADESTTSFPSYPPHQQAYDADYKGTYDDFDYDEASQKPLPLELPVDGRGGRPAYPFTQQQQLNPGDMDVDYEGGYDYGGQPAPPAKYSADKKTSALSKIWLHSLACRLFVLTIVIQTIIDLAIEGDMLLRFNEIDSDGSLIERMRVYLAVFAMAHVFQLILAIDAVYNKNTLQFLFLCAFNALFLIYSIVQISEVQSALGSVADPTSASSIANAIPIKFLTSSIPVVIGICEVAYIALGYRIYTEFGWQVYKFLGADRRIKKMYSTLQVYNCIIKFDLFFWIGFSVQFIWLVLQQEKDAEFYITWAVFPLSVLLLLEGHIAARYENRWMMYTFLTGCVGALVYFVYKLYKTLITINANPTTWASLTIFAVISIVFLFGTFSYATLVLRNFGNGLKTQLDKSQAEEKQPVSFGLGSFGAGAPGKGGAGVAMGVDGYGAPVDGALGQGMVGLASRKSGQFPMSKNPYRMSIE